MSILLVEPLVKQHNHLYLSLVDLPSVVPYKRDKLYEANNKDLVKKIFRFDLFRKSIFRCDSKVVLFLSSELQFLVLFSLLRLRGKKVYFICHEPRLWFGGWSNYLRAIINLSLMRVASRVLIFDEALASKSIRYDKISLWTTAKKNVSLDRSKRILSFGSETPNKNIPSLDLPWNQYDLQLVRAGITTTRFESSDVTVYNSFISDTEKDKFYRSSCISIFPYDKIAQSMVLLEAMSYGHIVILNGSNQAWLPLHDLSFVFVYDADIVEALVQIKALSDDDFIHLREKSLEYFDKINGQEIFKILSNIG